ncbi:carbohydrate sulfotransferase 8 isoform X1 [Electrophorus electricus]|uniref:carbohydrate sulfotransferase 8 isoform X1 n=1 Tax=Electrophorus electricus TaxID=8005 RepID=UPI0015CFFE7F|nr:carbohydrate sulfotransferase 8 isoform X1 [Electrophorus electricus]XP_035387832.1 carbohydrate sulfotransferase 8 isoform X1 [Electrophorus electricus]
MLWQCCKVRRCLRSINKKLTVSFFILLLFGMSGLLFFPHLQDLLDTPQHQGPGGKLLYSSGQLVKKEHCPRCLDDTQASGPVVSRFPSPVPPAKLPQRNPQSSAVNHIDITKNHYKLLNSSSPLQQHDGDLAGYNINTTDQLSQVQHARQNFMNKVCAKYGESAGTRPITRQHVSRIFVEDVHKLLYCEVPKVGCSNWKRVLTVLQGNASSPDKLKHEELHFGKHLKRLDSFNYKGIIYRLETYTKVLFSREPFERLVSAFRDKFENPNSYYHSVFGKRIISRYRKNPSRQALRTGAGVTFKEFIQYLLDVHRPVGMDIHWQLAAQLCSPCLIHYDFIGKFETMEEDANFLLRHIGAPTNLTLPSFKDRNPKAARTSSQITHKYFMQLSLKERQRTYDFYFMDYLLFNYSKPFEDLY